MSFLYQWYVFHNFQSDAIKFMIHVKPHDICKRMGNSNHNCVFCYYCGQSRVCECCGRFEKRYLSKSIVCVYFANRPSCWLITYWISAISESREGDKKERAKFSIWLLIEKWRIPICLCAICLSPPNAVLWTMPVTLCATVHLSECLYSDVTTVASSRREVCDACGGCGLSHSPYSLSGPIGFRGQASLQEQVTPASSPLLCIWRSSIQPLDGALQLSGPRPVTLDPSAGLSPLERGAD